MSELYTFEHKECGTSLVMATTNDGLKCICDKCGKPFLENKN